jgi:hypothetical protein
MGEGRADSQLEGSRTVKARGQAVVRPDLQISGVKVFSATLPAQRAALGEVVTAWIAANPGLGILDITVTQSSDADFHCLSITISYCQQP